MFSSHVSLTPNAVGYIRHPVLGDGDCGYTALGIERKVASKLLMKNISAVREMLKFPVQEALLTEKFYNDLFRKNILSVPLQSINNDEELRAWLATNVAVQLAYIHYDVRDKCIDAGYAHPCVLQAIACIQHIELHIWQLDENQILIPHIVYQENYAKYVPQMVEERVDLLFINNNHFERLDLSSYKKGYIPNQDIRPLTVSRSHNEGLEPEGCLQNDDFWRNQEGEALIQAVDDATAVSLWKVVSEAKNPQLSILKAALKKKDQSKACYFLEKGATEMILQQWGIPGFTELVLANCILPDNSISLLIKAFGDADDRHKINALGFLSSPRFLRNFAVCGPLLGFLAFLAVFMAYVATYRESDMKFELESNPSAIMGWIILMLTAPSLVGGLVSSLDFERLDILVSQSITVLAKNKNPLQKVSVSDVKNLEYRYQMHLQPAMFCFFDRSTKDMIESVKLLAANESIAGPHNI